MNVKRIVYMVPLAVCLLVAGGAMAQSTKGGIEGTVTDDAGMALPGVTVVISSDSMQGTKTAITGGDGKFRFVLLPVGTYEAVFSLSGFQTVEQQNVRVALEGVITLEVVPVDVSEIARADGGLTCMSIRLR